MRKLLFCTSIILIVASIFSGCVKERNITANELTLKVAIDGGHTCLFTLKSDGKLEFLEGLIKTPKDQKTFTLQADDFLNRDNYEHIVKIGEKQLTKKEINEIVTLANKVYKDKSLLNDEVYFTDTLEVYVTINDKTYHYFWYDSTKEKLEKLVAKLIELSPVNLDVNDLFHGVVIGHV